jgi:ribosomal protein S12
MTQKANSALQDRVCLVNSIEVTAIFLEKNLSRTSVVPSAWKAVGRPVRYHIVQGSWSEIVIKQRQDVRTAQARNNQPDPLV